MAKVIYKTVGVLAEVVIRVAVGVLVVVAGITTAAGSWHNNSRHCTGIGTVAKHQGADAHNKNARHSSPQITGHGYLHNIRKNNWLI